MDHFHYRDLDKDSCTELKKIIKDLQEHEHEVYKVIDQAVRELEFSYHRYHSDYTKSSAKESQAAAEKIKRIKKARNILRELLFYDFGD